MQASLDQKQRLQHLFFPDGIAFDGNRFNRTAATAPFFNYLAPAESAKVVAPRMALRVLDRAIQAHGGAGVSEDFPLARAWAHARTLRLADGPDEVHLAAIAKAELAKSR